MSIEKFFGGLNKYTYTLLNSNYVLYKILINIEHSYRFCVQVFYYLLFLDKTHIRVDII